MTTLQVVDAVPNAANLNPAAVTMNVTAVNAGGTGYITIWPCNRAMPVVSNLNVVAGDTVPNLVNVPIASGGTVCLFTTVATDLLADVAGFATTSTEPGYVIFIADY